MKYVELSEQEIQVLANLIDAAVRAQGLAVASNAVALIQKLESAKEVEAEVDL